MPDLKDGESAEVQGSARTPYILKNVGGVYSCTCPAWRNQSVAIERRTCKHLRAYRGEQAEQDRLGSLAPAVPKAAKEDGDTAPQLLLAHPWENDTDLTGWWMTREARRRAGLVGRQAVPFAARQRLSCPGLVRRRLAQRAARRRTLARPQGVPAYREHRPPPGQERPLAGDQVRAVRRSRRQRPIRGAAEGPCRDDPAAASAVCQACSTRPAVPSIEALKVELARVESLGGEGLMLRQPGSQYEAGRSTTLLKVKTFHDAEGRVVEHLPGKGRHAGRLGAVVVELPDGQTFSVGTGFSDAQRQNPPAIGSTITYRYQEMTDRGVPRFPSFVSLRTDVAQPKAAVPSPARSKQVQRNHNPVKQP